MNDQECVRFLQWSLPQLQMRWKGFRKVRLEPGEEKQVTFMLTPRQLAVINENGEKIIEPGNFTVYLGGAQPDHISGDLNPNTMVLEKSFSYTGPNVKL